MKMIDSARLWHSFGRMREALGRVNIGQPAGKPAQSSTMACRPSSNTTAFLLTQQGLVTLSAQAWPDRQSRTSQCPRPGGVDVGLGTSSYYALTGMLQSWHRELIVVLSVAPLLGGQLLMF